MACERDRGLELREYLESLGICVNIGKTKARGHKGIFMQGIDLSRIDISGSVEKENILSVILHEFAHYIHYQNDKTLSSLDFIFEDFNEDIQEELIKITVDDIPKNFASALYSKKETLNSELKVLINKIRNFYPNFKLSEKNISIEHRIKFPFKYLLKYDRVKVSDKIYSLSDAEECGVNEPELLYIQIKSKQRAIRRINSKINRLNRYYNSPAELFARFIDAYYTKPDFVKNVAPKATYYLKKSENSYIKMLNSIFM